jgi:hypothetical protein
VVQRRGGRVSTPKIGSRVGVFVFGGILGIHADLRREFGWGNLKFGFFGVLVEGPREVSEEGDQWCAFVVCLGDFRCVFGGFYCGSPCGVNGVT